MTFNLAPILEDSRFRLRPLVETDRTGLHAAASDRLIWAGHPAKDRHRPEVFDRYFDFLLAAGGTLVFTEIATGQIIGCSRFYFAPPDADAVSIGFTFLVRAHWGGSTNRAIKTLMLDHAFAHADRVWFHIDPANQRSQNATVKLGARYVASADLDLATGPAPWMCFRLSRDDWALRRKPPAP